MQVEKSYEPDAPGAANLAICSNQVEGVGCRVQGVWCKMQFVVHLFRDTFVLHLLQQEGYAEYPSTFCS